MKFSFENVDILFQKKNVVILQDSHIYHKVTILLFYSIKKKNLI